MLPESEHQHPPTEQEKGLTELSSITHKGKIVLDAGTVDPSVLVLSGGTKVEALQAFKIPNRPEKPFADALKKVSQEIQKALKIALPDDQKILGTLLSIVRKFKKTKTLLKRHPETISGSRDHVELSSLEDLTFSLFEDDATEEVLLVIHAKAHVRFGGTLPWGMAQTYIVIPDEENGVNFIRTDEDGEIEITSPEGMALSILKAYAAIIKQILQPTHFSR